MFISFSVNDRIKDSIEAEDLSDYLKSELCLNIQEIAELLEEHLENVCIKAYKTMKIDPLDIEGGSNLLRDLTGIDRPTIKEVLEEFSKT